MTAIELEGLEKRFGAVTALTGVDLAVEEGEIFGFLGPNGAGKSTTIDILLDFVRPTAGSARVLGRDAQEESVAIRRRTGVLPEGFDVYDRLTARQHLEFVAESKEVSIEPLALLERVGIAEAADRQAGGYSKGMTQRLALAMALVGEPDLLILDEPTSGLDPNGARELREIIREERDRGATVFFSSHVLGQVEAVCDRAAILTDGEVVAIDDVDALRATADAGSHLSVTVDDLAESAVGAVRELAGVSEVTVDGTTVDVACTADAKFPTLTALADAGVEIRDFETTDASLEDLFVEVTGGDGEETQPAPATADGGQP